jgi:elongation factor P
MDTESFDQVPLSGDQLTDSLPYLVEQLEVDLIFHQDLPIAIEIPTNVDLKVTDSPPGLRGDTATGATKPATLETGHQLQVPLFVNEGETIRVDTRTGQYQSRV